MIPSIRNPLSRGVQLQAAGRVHSPAQTPTPLTAVTMDFGEASDDEADRRKVKTLFFIGTRVAVAKVLTRDAKPNGALFNRRSIAVHSYSGIKCIILVALYLSSHWH